MIDKKLPESTNIEFGLEQLAKDEKAFHAFMLALDADLFPSNLESLTPMEKELLLKDTFLKLYEENNILSDRIEDLERGLEEVTHHLYTLHSEIKAAFKEMSGRDEKTIEKNTVDFNAKEKSGGATILLNPAVMKNNPSYKKMDNYAYPMANEVGGKWTVN